MNTYLSVRSDGPSVGGATQSIPAWKKGWLYLAALSLFFSAVQAVQAGLTSYSGQSTLPIGYGANGSAYGNGVYIVVGGNGYIYRSTDGQNWAVATNSSLLNTNYNAVAFGNGIFVAVAQAGGIVTSGNGLDWSIQSSGTGNYLTTIGYFNGKFITAGNAGTVLTSTNGTNWVSQNLGIANSFRSVTYGAGKYLMTAYSDSTKGGTGTGLVFSSATGTGSWTSGTVVANDFNIYNGVVWLNNKFYLFRIDTTNYVSSDGSSWSLLPAPILNSPDQVFGGLYANGTYYLYGSDTNGTYGAIYSSTDGTNFSELVPKTMTDVINSLTCNNGVFIETGNGGFATSSDALHWKFPAGSYTGVAYNGTNYVAVGLAGSDGYITTSPDWVNWSNTTPKRMQSLTSVVASKGKFIAVGYNGNGLPYAPIVTSTDGYNWSVTNTFVAGVANLPDDFLSLAADNSGILVAAGDYGHILRSTDNGTTWSVITPAPPKATNGLASVAYINSQFVAVGYGGAVIYSTDGASWSDASYNGDTGAYLTGVTYGTGGYILIGADSTNYNTFVLKRTSLTSGSWTVPATPPPSVPYPNFGWFVTYGSGSYMEFYNDANGEGFLATSTDGNTWVQNDLNSQPLIAGVTYTAGIFRLVGYDDFKGTATASGLLPGITSALSASGTNGSPFTYTITASNSPTSFGASGLPSGLSVNTVSGVISGTPTVYGSYSVSISATNASGSGSATLALTIANSNTPPTFVGSTTTLLVGENAGATDIKGLLHVSDTDSSQTETWTQSSAPSHGTLSFSSATAASGSTDIAPGGTITYTPLVNYFGIDSFSVQVSDGHGGTATRTITVTVNPPPGITSALTASGTNNSAFTYTITASNNPTSFGASGLPSGLNVNTANGLISGTPTTHGSFPVIISATNATGFGTATLTLTIVNTNTPPVFVGSTTSLLVGENANATDITGLLHVSDPDSGQTETWSQYSAPSHGTLSFSGATASGGSADIVPGGTITYTPATTYFGSDSFAVQVSDGNGGTATRTISVTINPMPGITSGTITNGIYGSPFTYTITASNSPTSFGAGGLPGGLGVDTASGLISGTPTQSGVFPVTISATNSTSSGTATLTLTIAQVNLTTSGIFASNKIYDGNKVATLNLGGATLNGVVNGDSISLVSTGVSAAFADANVGTGKVVTVSGLALSGVQAANYTLTQPVTNADILPAHAFVTIHRSVQLYDGSLKSVTATTLPLGLPVNLAYNGSSSPSAVGAYTVIGTIANPNYWGAATNYLYVVTPPQFTDARSFGNTNIVFTWSTMPQVNYQVICTPSLSPVSWTNFYGQITATNTTTSTMDVIPSGSSTRFYWVRVILE